MTVSDVITTSFSIFAAMVPEPSGSVDFNMQMKSSHFRTNFNCPVCGTKFETEGWLLRHQTVRNNAGLTGCERKVKKDGYI